MSSKLRVDEIVGAQGSTVSIGTATFTGGLSGDITGLNVTGVITATTLNQTLGAGSSITIGDTFIRQGAVGLGTTDTAGRNAGVGTAVGTLIFNSTTNAFEGYGPQGWARVALTETGLTATGGTIADYTDGSITYRTHTFTSPGTFEVTSVGTYPAEVDYLVVAGGGGGGRGTFTGGGGGAGGFRTSMPEGPGGTGTSAESKLPVSTSPGSYPVTVGGGGNASTGSNANNSTQGSPSVFGPITATGGGRGADGPVGNPGGPGGSGGGAQGDGSTPASGGTAVSPTQGHPGGGHPGTSGAPHYTGGGGGGAGQAGGAAGPTRGPSGYGGFGKRTTITGPAYSVGTPGPGGTGGYLAGGGGSGAENPAPDPGAGYGGGGYGNYSPAGNAASPGTTNTGGGGGGDGNGGHGAGNGGSGIVVVRYRISADQ